MTHDPAEPESVSSEEEAWGDDGPPPSPRVRLWLRVLQRFVQVTLALVALLIAIVVGWLQSRDFEQRIIDLVESGLEDAIGEQITITGVNARYWPPGITAEGVHIFHQPTGETILSVERIRVPIRLRWSGAPEAGRIYLQRPVVHLHVEGDGNLREFRNRIRPPAELRRPLSRLPFRALDIVDGQVRVTYPDGFVEIDHLEVTPRRRTARVGGDLTIRFRSFQQSTHIEWPDVQIGPEAIVVPRLGLDTSALSLGGRVAFDLDGPLDAALSAKVRLEPLQPLLGEPRLLHGLVDVDVRVSGPPSDLQAQLLVHGADVGADLPGVLTPFADLRVR